MLQVRVVLFALLLSMLFLACGENEPEEGGEYYPMAVGNTWDYKETAIDGTIEILRYTVTEKTTMSFDNGVGEREVYALENVFPDEGALPELRIQYIEDDGVRAIRHQHLIYEDGSDLSTLTKQRDFVPGFLRFDREKTREGDSWVEELMRYTDTMDGTQIAEEGAMYRFEIVSVSEKVTVPAGTFNCLKIRRTDIAGQDNETKEYYYSSGIGKVKEVTVDVKTEELISYEVNVAD